MTLETVSVNLSDRELISRAQGGDTAAFEALVHRYDNKVMAIASSFTNDPDDTKDIYQDVFLRVFRALPGFEFRSEFSTWLFRVVTNVCITYKSRNRTRTFTSIEEEVEGYQLRAEEESPLATARPLSPERLAEASEMKDHIELALDALSKQQKLVFVLKHYQGYKFREIASMMECSEGTVKKYMFTAMDKMRKRLRHLYR